MLIENCVTLSFVKKVCSLWLPLGLFFHSSSFPDYSSLLCLQLIWVFECTLSAEHNGNFSHNGRLLCMRLKLPCLTLQIILGLDNVLSLFHHLSSHCLMIYSYCAWVYRGTDLNRDFVSIQVSLDLQFKVRILFKIQRWHLKNSDDSILTNK